MYRGMQGCMGVMGNQMKKKMDDETQTLSPVHGVYGHSIGIVPESNTK